MSRVWRKIGLNRPLRDVERRDKMMMTNGGKKS